LSQTDHHRLQIPAIDGREVLTQDDFCKRIRHWNASGHKKLGQQLGDFLNRLIDIDQFVYLKWVVKLVVRTSLNHQPEAQHPKFSVIHKLAADYPICLG
jgi:hypothetical protein